MVWVRFTEDYDFRATKRATVSYKAGTKMNVTRECADRAIAAGKAFPEGRKEEPATDFEADEGTSVFLTEVSKVEETAETDAEAD